MNLLAPHPAIWIIAAAATAGVIVRPFKLPEAIWAVTGALLLVLFGLLPVDTAWQAVLRGADVYFFLTGMMLLSEVARHEGLFDYFADVAVARAHGSRFRLFALVYMIGTGVTVFLSNDATAVVLTPAVLAATRAAKVKPLPYLLVCAFIANAASFVLPISNPANIVITGDHAPPLLDWLRRFSLPSVAAIVATFLALWLVERRDLSGRYAIPARGTSLSAGGRSALLAIGITALLLLAASALDIQLGLPTLVMGLLTLTTVSMRTRRSPLPLLRDVSWSILPLVAGLFVLVVALDRTGVIGRMAAMMHVYAERTAVGTAAVTGTLLAFACNLSNNLPAGLVASLALQQAPPPTVVRDALLIGVDLGPNLSITGSLATVLWLAAIRRENQDVGFWKFLSVGVVVMPPALLLAIGARIVLAG